MMRYKILHLPLFTLLILLSINFGAFSQCPSGAIGVSCGGCLSGCNLTSFGGPNCVPATTGNCASQTTMSVDIVVPDGCTFTVNAQMQNRPGCSASGGDSGDQMKVDVLGGSKVFQSGGSNATLTDSYVLVGPGTIRVQGTANRRDEIITYQTTSSGALCTACISSLPIELTEFNAVAKEAVVELNWITASEYNNDYFIIERSLDGKNFTAIGRVNGQGNSTAPFYYTEIDNEPYFGISYYLLKQTDFDGTTTSSKVVSVNFTGADYFKIQPNPAVNEFFIQGKGAERAQITILNSLGQTVELIPHIQNSSVKYDVSSLQKGSYLVRINYQNVIQTKKLFIQ